MNICIVGTGYVGLVVGTCLSDFGMNVICIDNDQSKIDMLNNGEVPIYEIGLGEKIERNVKLNRLHFSTDLKSAIQQSLVIFIGVGTPENEHGSVNLDYINKVAFEIAKSINDYKVIVIKSTVPVGTAKKLKQLIKENIESDIDFDIVSNPEFLREGTAVSDFLRPDRVVIGSYSEKALAIVRDIYRPLYLLETPIISTTNETAELIKYAANTMLALKISYINEIANICEKIDADVYDVAIAVGMDKRIGKNFLHPGPGFGGSCFPKDINELVKFSRANNFEFKLAEALLDVNERQKEIVIQKAVDTLGAPKGKVVTILGLSFKPDTDDTRESPSLDVAQKLSEMGALVNAYDPIAMNEAKSKHPKFNYCDDAYQACENSSLVMILTEWNEFRDLQFDRIKKLVAQPVIYDTRNIYKPEIVRKAGFKYICTGRP